MFQIIKISILLPIYPLNNNKKKTVIFNVVKI